MAEQEKTETQEKTPPEEKPKAEEKAKEEGRPKNCGQCKKRLSPKQWYYRNGNYFCSKGCWKTAKGQKQKTAA